MRHLLLLSVLEEFEGLVLFVLEDGIQIFRLRLFLQINSNYCERRILILNSKGK